jgi:hypothetical protein
MKIKISCLSAQEKHVTAAPHHQAVSMKTMDTNNIFDSLVFSVGSDRITDALLSQMTDKNWKVRNEGLQKVTEILKEAKFVTANLGGLPEAMKARLSESNKNLV